MTHMTKKDYFCMGTLMLIFAILVFFRLGNAYAPETYHTTSPDNRDIILDFGEYISISTMEAFLGNLDNRSVSISVFNEVTGEWEVINGEHKIVSVFQWNEIPIHYYTRYLGFVFLDESAVINEFVFFDQNGEILTPANTGEYPTLFDEQDMFPDTVTYLCGTMFDEIYHGRTGYEFLHNLRTYETTHPHLGKILISLGIAIFGMNPFGWRFMSAIFGILIIGVMYLFAKKLFGNTFIATATAGLFTFDCMHYTLSRIATIDIFAAFFILLMYYFMYEYMTNNQNLDFAHTTLSPKILMPLALSGVCMAMGIATKWTGVYAGIGLAVLFFWYTLLHYPGKQTLRLFIFCCVFFIAIPLLVYTLSFIPVVGYEESNLIQKTIDGSLSMFNYHSQLVAEHYYSSPFYEWPIIWMPLLYANDAVNDTYVSAISCMGNPAIWWPGIICILFILYRWIIRKDKKAGFLLIAYAAQYVPWMSVGRITFIYHYFPAILFVILMIGYTMQFIIDSFPKGKRTITVYLGIVLVVFFLFFPVISGTPLPLEWGLKLRWLKDWIIVL